MWSIKRKVEREIKDDVHIKFQRSEQVTPDLVNRLGLEKELEGHGGCVNCLEWNEKGNMLASGSDDLNVILWDPFNHKMISKLQTGHQGNIFSVKFLPHSNDALIVTGAADHRINVHDLNRKETTHVFTYHLGRVKRIATAPNLPYLFWSAAEDGTIMQFDLRCTSTTTSAPNNILINLNAHMGQFAEAKCLAINPLRPEMLAVGANDPYVRMYDRRMLNLCSMQIPGDNVNSHVNDGPNYPAKGYKVTCYEILGTSWRNAVTFSFYVFKAAGHTNHKGLASTYLTFGPDGSELLVNLGGEQIYLFDVNRKLRPRRFDISILGTNGLVKDNLVPPTNGYSLHTNGTNGVYRGSSSSLSSSSSSSNTQTRSAHISSSLLSPSSISDKAADHSGDLPNKRSV
uniref:Uncharacterized protein n=1 Tax=Biomphalaria glabrata TaxID=6526 RepID=A0A2C9JP84_BIOGL